MAIKSVLAILFALIGITTALSFSEECLHAHNLLRNLHQNTGPLTWDSALAQDAQEWADQIAVNGALMHDSGDFGENIYWSSDSSLLSACSRATLKWYKELENYSYYTTDTIITGKFIGHFTQVVWKASTKLGVGIAQGSSGTFIVARYIPRGNSVELFYGEDETAAHVRVFTENVLPRKPGAVTPNIYQLDPSACANLFAVAKCELYADYYKCSNSYVSDNCPKYCGVC